MKNARRRCLVHVFGPGNALAAICAVKWYGLSCCGDADAVVTVVCYNPGLSDDVAHESASVVDRITQSQGWQNVVMMRRNDIDAILPPSQPAVSRSVCRHFRNMIGADSFDEIYYPHDLVGRVAELMMKAYSRAARITFGDALGTLNDRDHKFRLLGLLPSETRKHGLLAAFAKGCTVARGLLGRSTVTANRAVLVLPIDDTGHCLKGKELSVVPKEILLNVIRDCNDSIPELGIYAKSLLQGTRMPRFLVLMENFTDGGRTTYNSEVGLYVRMVRDSAPKSSTILLKPHPNANVRMVNAVEDLLKVDYPVRVMPRELNRYPVELWRDLVANVEVISMGYPNISLRFLYGKTVVNPISTALIEDHFSPQTHSYYGYFSNVVREWTASLNDWGGRGVLWRG